MNDKNKLIDQINKLSQKYSTTGQDLHSYLEGLLYADYVGYWDYINLDTLLSLQNPKTDFPDEKIFIIYHQITELYFQLCLLELEQINKNGRKVIDTGEDLGWHKSLKIDFFIERLERINRYISHLIQSFDIMIQGMNKEQFLKFRMALLPSSGFQSAQYRMIEIQSTNLINLTNCNKKDTPSLYKNIYWKSGAIDLSKNKKTYTLQQFEKKYDNTLLKLAQNMTDKNVLKKYQKMSSKDKKNKKLIQLLKTYDTNINVNWKLAHYKSAVKYLHKKQKDIMATGGTNWQHYLPPKFQKIIFFPELWTAKEKAEWGKSWVQSMTS